MSKEAYYFSHDANARHDPKILAMRSVYGIQGYAVFWIVIEMMREQEDFRLPNKNYIFNAIAMQVQCKNFSKDDAKKFVEDCINEFDLLCSDEHFIWSNSLLKRMNKKNSLSEKRREAARKRWEKPSNDKENEDDEECKQSNAMQNDTNAMQNDARKGKEIKEKERKEKENIRDKKTSSRKSKIYDEDSDCFRLANRLFENILKNNPNHKKPDLQKWADDVRLMMERDKRPYDHIEFLIDWVQDHSFWRKNILSISKLREQFDRLVLECKDQQERSNNNSKQNRKPKAFQSLEDWAEEDD